MISLYKVISDLLCTEMFVFVSDPLLRLTNCWQVHWCFCNRSGIWGGYEADLFVFASSFSPHFFAWFMMTFVGAWITVTQKQTDSWCGTMLKSSWLQKTGLALQETGVSMMTSMSYGQKNIWFPPCLATEVDTKAGVDGELPHCCCSFGNFNGLWYVSILLVWLWWFFFLDLEYLWQHSPHCITKMGAV